MGREGARGNDILGTIGPTDRPEEVTGAWTLEDDTLVVSRGAEGRPDRRMRVRSAGPDRLVVAKD
jgi:hypothetical protein